MHRRKNVGQMKISNAAKPPQRDGASTTRNGPQMVKAVTTHMKFVWWTRTCRPRAANGCTDPCSRLWKKKRVCVWQRYCALQNVADLLFLLCSAGSWLITVHLDSLDGLFVT